MIKCIIALTIAQVSSALIHLLIDGRMPVIGESLSRYVGKAWWSSLILAASDFFAAYQLIRYGREINAVHKMPKIWWVCGACLIIGLIGLSLCPLGLFDANFNNPGIISNCHEFCSRFMFVSMISVVLGIAITFGYKSKITLAACLTYLAFSCFFVGGYIADLSIYNSIFFVWENLFLYGFFLTLLTVPSALKVESEADADTTQKSAA
jgi:hypothetical protein